MYTLGWFIFVTPQLNAILIQEDWVMGQSLVSVTLYIPCLMKHLQHRNIFNVLNQNLRKISNVNI